MPQLDLVTFLTQYVWLVISYVGFYFILVHHFLPIIARIMKVRAAIVQKGQESATAGGEEKTFLAKVDADTATVVQAMKAHFPLRSTAIDAWSRTLARTFGTTLLTSRAKHAIAEDLTEKGSAQKALQSVNGLSVWNTISTSAVTKGAAQNYHTTVMFGVLRANNTKEAPTPPQW